MAITLSTFSVGPAQVDGRHYIAEKHTDNVGLVYVYEYLGDATQTDVDRTNIMNARATDLASALAIQEYLNRVSVDGWPGPLVYQTAAQFANKLRFEYRNSSQQRVAYLAYWLLNRINDGTFTDLQVQNAFGMTAVQYSTFKTNQLIPLHDHWAAVLAAVGQ